MSNSKSTFWADLSKKTGTWSAVAALAVAVAEVVEPLLDNEATISVDWHHAAAVLGAAVVRAIVGLIQGNVGDRTKATFSKATVHQQIEPPAGDDPAE